MSKRRFFGLAEWLLCVMLLAHCATEQEVPSTPGKFKGTTSQGEELSLWVERVNDQMMITSIQYSVELTGGGWSATTHMRQAESREIGIVDGQFSGTRRMRGETEEISGTFVGDDSAEGRLYCTLEHPQGLGRATADITFEAQRADA